MVQTAAWILAAMGMAAFGPVGCGEPDRQAVTIRGERFILEIADDKLERTTGLMHRASLPDNGGMLFIFPEAAERAFWMKNCLIDLDVIFLDPQGKVVRIHTMTVPDPSDVDPPKYRSGAPAQFVIELNAGKAGQLGLKPGQTVDLPLATLKERAR